MPARWPHCVSVAHLLPCDHHYCGGQGHHGEICRSEEEPDITQLKTRNVYSVLVNAQNQLLVRNQPMDIRELRENAVSFISNPRQREDYAERPTKAIIMLKNDRGTNYKTYLELYNELKGAYNDLWNEASLKKYGVPYDEDKLPLAYRKAIKVETDGTFRRRTDCLRRRKVNQIMTCPSAEQKQEIMSKFAKKEEKPILTFLLLRCPYYLHVVVFLYGGDQDAGFRAETYHHYSIRIRADQAGREIIGVDYLHWSPHRKVSPDYTVPSSNSAQR